MGEVVGNVSVQKRGVVSLGLVKGRIPLEDGDVLQVMIEDGKIVLIPMKMIPAEQAWFWTAKWQEAEKQAQADLKAGRTKAFPNVDELLEDLDS
ncbi:MAG: AbrB/MazE/SpoVT family DNA-binding domain-containing protein [Bacillota bacterium]